MKENLIHYRTCVCNINYHIVWSVKYRRKIITPEIEAFLRQTALNIAAEKGFTLHLFESGEQDHIHCFVSAPPTISISLIVKYLKGITARKLFAAYPAVRNYLWKGVLWNPSYYIETVGSVSEENIRRYIADQKQMRLRGLSCQKQNISRKLNLLHLLLKVHSCMGSQTRTS